MSILRFHLVRMAILLSILPASALFGQKMLPPGQVDYSGVEQFWKTLELLSANSEPTPEEWDHLFTTPCYAYIAKGGRAEQIKKRFMLAYMPSLKDEKERALSKNNYEARIIKHLDHVNTHKAHIHKYIDSLKKVDILINALKLTQNYLPANFVKENKESYPPVAFGIFEPDGQANSKMIAVDIAFAQLIDFNAFFAHEAHHFFISKIRRPMKPAEGGEEHILKTIRQLHFEGIADLIDKKGIIATPDTLKEAEDWYAFHYKNHYNKARATFQKLDHLIGLCADGIDRDKNGKLVAEALHFGTHPEALHMSMLIEDTYGREKIIQLLNSPFDFFRAYRRAAKKNPSRGWVFSQKTMRYLAQLETRYGG